jgi:hypothetical protein
MKRDSYIKTYAIMEYDDASLANWFPTIRDKVKVPSQFRGHFHS